MEDVEKTEWKEEPLLVNGDEVSEMKEKTTENVNNRYTDPITGKFIEGNPGGGRPPLTEEDKIKKKAVQEFIEDYKQNLAEALPLLSPILIKKAMSGDVIAIKEINDRVMGKAPQSMDVSLKGEIGIKKLEEELKKLNESPITENSNDGVEVLQGRAGEADDINREPVSDIPVDIQEALQ